MQGLRRATTAGKSWSFLTHYRCSLINIQDVGDHVFRERINAFVREFVHDALEKCDTNSIRSIVLSGEASALWIHELDEMARKAVATDSVKIMTEIAPADVVAHGVAWWVELVQQTPYAFRPGARHRFGKNCEHDEL